MYFDLFGIPFDFSPQNIFIAGFITFAIILIHQFFRSMRIFSPFKKDKLANESLFFIYMVHSDYVRAYQGFSVEGREEFSRKLWQVSQVYDLHRMQEESYRIQFQSLLQRHHGRLKEAYDLFEGLNHVPNLKGTDVAMVVKRTHHILNTIILDINEEFKEEDHHAA